MDFSLEQVLAVIGGKELDLIALRQENAKLKAAIDELTPKSPPPVEPATMQMEPAKT